MRRRPGHPGWTIPWLLLVVAACSPNQATRSSAAAPAAATRAAASTLRFAVYGDTRTNNEVHQDIVNKVLTFSPDLVLQTGDLVHDGDALDQWMKFDEITSTMRRRIPYCPVRGNHDVGKKHYYEARVARCFGAGNKLFYSFEQRGVHFVGIDTEQALDPESVQYRWLQADLAAARGAGRFIIPFFHKAIVSVGPHSVEMDVQSLRPILHALFRQYGISLVFQGHDHHYYHARLDGITYVVSAGGGAPLYDWRAQPGAGDVFEKVYHFCIADVEHTRITVTAYRQDLSQLDRFELPIAPALIP